MNKNEMVLGAPMQGGGFGGRIRIAGDIYALIVPPKARGQYPDDVEWHDSTRTIKGARSYHDGMANTLAMAKAGSKIAEWARGLIIDDCDDFYIPSLDEQEVLYRELKPTTDKNSEFYRSGINLHAVPAPAPPYTPDFPLQTTAELYRAAGDEAFDPLFYWTSTQYARYPDFAWCLYFRNGNQDFSHKSIRFRVRAIRRVPI